MYAALDVGTNLCPSTVTEVLRCFADGSHQASSARCPFASPIAAQQAAVASRLQVALTGVQSPEQERRRALYNLVAAPIEEQSASLAQSSNSCHGADGRHYMPAHLDKRVQMASMQLSPSLQMVRTSGQSVMQRATQLADSLKSVQGPQAVIRFFDALNGGVSNATISARSTPTQRMPQPAAQAFPRGSGGDERTRVRSWIERWRARKGRSNISNQHCNALSDALAQQPGATSAPSACDVEQVQQPRLQAACADTQSLPQVAQGVHRAATLENASQLPLEEAAPQPERHPGTAAIMQQCSGFPMSQDAIERESAKQRKRLLSNRREDRLAKAMRTSTTHLQQVCPE